MTFTDDEIRTMRLALSELAGYHKTEAQRRLWYWTKEQKVQYQYHRQLELDARGLLQKLARENQPVSEKTANQ